jgi:hypothetical protein
MAKSPKSISPKPKTSNPANTALTLDSSKVIKSFEASYSPSVNQGKVTITFTDLTTQVYDDIADITVDCLVAMLTRPTRSYSNGIITITG